jgi:small subunit ribosomal protein S18
MVGRWSWFDECGKRGLVEFSSVGYIFSPEPRRSCTDFPFYKDIELLTKLVNRHGRIVSRRKSGCSATSQHAVAEAVKRARFMALMPYVGE